MDKGVMLYAHVYIPEGRRPRMLALEWHDGDGWDHRAYWGDDRLRDGTNGTQSRMRAGDVPREGKWVRLEVPAWKVGLEGRKLHGVAFKVHDGQVYWGGTGTVRTEAATVEVTRSFPLAQRDGAWVGDFPLVGKGKFRVELKSPHGHPCLEQPARFFEAVPDLPPTVVLDRAGTSADPRAHEHAIPRAGAVPLGITAGDDVGLDFLRLLTRTEAGGEYRTRTLWSAGDRPPPPTRRLNDAMLSEATVLKPGEAIRYLIEVQDTKGQKTRTPEQIVRVVPDGGASETREKALDKERDAFLEKLAQLMAKQKKISERLAELEQEHARLDEKVADLRDEGKRPDGKPLDDKIKPDPAKDKGGLTPEELKKLADLQKELAKLGAEEDKNAAEAGMLNDELKKMADAAGKNEFLPQDIADALKSTSSLFDRVITNAMKDLGKKLKDGAVPQKGSPDVKGSKRDGDKLDADLKGLKDRLEGIKDAKTEALKGDVSDALKKLKDRMDAEDAKAAARDAARELADLKDLLDKLREQLKGAREANDEASDPDNKSGKKTPGKKMTREELEKEIKRLLDRAKKLLDKGPMAGDEKPEFPDDPFSDDGKEKKVPPREMDTDEPLPKKKDAGEKKDAGDKDGEKKGDGNKKGDDDPEEKLFQPRLGGPKEKIDPRYKDKQRPVEKKGDKGDKDGEKGNESGKLDGAEKALDSDSKTLDKLLDALKDAAKGKEGKDGKDGKDGKGKEGKGKEGKGEGEGDEGGDPQLKALADALKQMLGSKGMKDARAMAKAAKALKEAMGKGEAKGGDPMPSPTQKDEGNLDGGNTNEKDGKLADLDPALRAMILKLPPRLREDILRGRKNKGPEAYEEFVQDYFKRLSEGK